MDGVRGLVGMLHHGRLGGVTPGRSTVGCGVDGAHRQVNRFQECQAEVIGLLERRSRREPHRVMNGRMLP